MDKKITVLITDDHPVARAGVRTMLEQVPDIEIIGEAQDGDEAQKLVADLRPQVLLLDLKMPGLSAAELEKWVRVNYPEIVTLVLTAHDRDAYLAGMMEAGAAGYLPKSERGENLVAAIRRAARGECLFTDEQFERARKWRKNAGEKMESLTEREREVLKLLTAGLNNAAMAKSLGITPKTIAYHVTEILQKLEVHSRLEAAAWVSKYFPNDLEEIPG